MKRSIAAAGFFVALFMGQGCQEKPLDPSTPAATTPSAQTADRGGGSTKDHSHGAGPHGGAVSDWGGGAYHVEFTVDHDAKQSTVYVLGSDGKTPAPVKAEKITLSIDEPAFDVQLKAQPWEGEPAGSASRFAGQHDNFGVVRAFAGAISGVVEGTPYVGEFAEVAGEN
jgi:hypothetical protein